MFAEIRETEGKWEPCTMCSFFVLFFFAFPSYISGVHHFLGEIFAYVTVFQSNSHPKEFWGNGV